MGSLVLYMSMSLDGFIAGPGDSKDNPFGTKGHRLHEWLGDGGEDLSGFRPDDEPSQTVFDEMMSTGAVITGRRTGDFVGYWGGDHHDGVPIFVPTHRAPASVPPGDVRFVTDGIESCVGQDQVGPLFDWYSNGDAELVEGGMMKVSQASAGYVRPMWASIGSMVIGRHLFDITNGWEGSPPAGEDVVVVSHRPEPDGWRPEASQPGHPHPRQPCPYYFVDDVAQAIAKARELAGERTVAVAAGDVGGQALALGLVDEVAMDVVPVVFGSGKRYFGSVDAQHLLEDPHTVIRGDRVLHLRYRVRRS